VTKQHHHTPPLLAWNAIKHGGFFYLRHLFNQRELPVSGVVKECCVALFERDSPNGLTALDAVIKLWAAAGFKDTLLRLLMKQEIANGNEKAIQSGVQG
jgi:hypothetical protein